LPGGTSLKNFRHWVQTLLNKKFAHFDYGKEKNLILYNQEEPPEYNFHFFKNYTVRSLITFSNADPFSKIEDFNSLYLSHIDMRYVKIRKYENYNHMDYFWSMDPLNDVFKDILSFMKDPKKLSS